MGLRWPTNNPHAEDTLDVLHVNSQLPRLLFRTTRWQNTCPDNTFQCVSTVKVRLLTNISSRCKAISNTLHPGSISQPSVSTCGIETNQTTPPSLGLARD